MNWHLHSRARGLIVTGVLVLVLIVITMGGDFNAIPFSRTIRLLKPRFDDVLWPSLDYFTGTYKNWFPDCPQDRFSVCVTFSFS